ncbi:hypothetical protein [Synechococcus sp. GEYO]|uniref:hypothetical protein n=1 Tax=Synechococcus sp. GEYO TaxID=2575511 RepID=UPI000E0F35F8|nr:hypothetical protein [Synechococcus sp. GEYO]
MPTRLPTSRDYWNLRAEQVMDRVFNDRDNILETVQVQVYPQTAQSAQGAQTEASTLNLPALTWPQVSLAALGLIAVLGSSGLALHWGLSQQALEREGNLALIERLRNNQLAQRTNNQNKPAPTTTSQTATEPSSEATSTSNELEISALPNASATQLDPITVPLPTAKVTSTTSIAGQAPAVAPQPLLVGVVHAGNGDGSAIFQLGDLSLSTVPGEAIGNSGWTLQSVSTNGAVIERSGARQTLSVGGAF